MTNTIKSGKVYSINQQQYTLRYMLENNALYCSGLAVNESGGVVNVKQYKQPLTDHMKLAAKTLTQQDIPMPVEAREIVRGRITKYENCVVEPHSGATLAGFLNYEAGKKHLDKAIELCKLVHTIHSKGYALGNLNLGSIEVTEKGLQFKGAEFAQKTNEPAAKEQDIKRLCELMMVAPEVGPSLFQFDGADETLKAAISTPNIQANQLSAFLILNLAGNNAYQRIIETPKLATTIMQKYDQHKNDPEALDIAIKSVVQSSFKRQFENIRNQRLSTPDSDVSTVLEKWNGFESTPEVTPDPTPPGTPKFY